MLELSFVADTRLSIVGLRQCSSRNCLDLLHMYQLLSQVSCNLIVQEISTQLLVSHTWLK